MRSLRRSFKGVNFRKRSQHITLTVLVLVLTVSIVLAVPEKNTSSTQLILSSKTANTNGELLWNKTFGEIGQDEGYCVLETSDGGYIITGKIVEDLWLIKTDANGNHVWNQTYGGIEEDLGYCVEKTDDDGYIIVGWTESFSVGGTDVWLIKTNSTGGLEWNKTYGGPLNDMGYSVIGTSDGGYIISGHYATISERNVWLIKTDANGDHQWNETYLEVPNLKSEGYCVVETSDGGYIIVGYTQTTGNGAPPDVLLLKTNSTGGFEWSQTYGGTGWDEGFSVLQSSDEGYIITGYTQPYGVSGPNDIWLIKTNSTGGHEWNRTYGGTEYQRGFDVAQASDGGYIIIGSREQMLLSSKMSVRGYITDALLIKTDENGNQKWNRTYGGSGPDIGMSVVQNSDGDYVFAGYTYSYSDASNSDVWLLKVASGFPVIDQPADIIYEEGSTGNNIMWHPEDAEPSSYTITSNETLVESGSWDGGNIMVNIDGLAIGVYLYTCTVNDKVDQSASDTVMVTVTEPEEDGGFPWGGLFFVLAVIGLATVIIYSTQYAKKP